MRPEPLVLALALLAAPLGAQEAPAGAPVQIQADSAMVDERSGVSTYTGAVEVEQGGLRLQAAEVRVYAPQRRLQRVEAEADADDAEDRVRFRQREADGEEVRAEARRMDYDAETGEITLTGAARLWRGESVVVSERIVYDSRAQVVSAGSQAQGERVNAIILPAAAPEAPEATETDESPSGAAGEAAAASPDAAPPAPEAAAGQ